MRSILAISFLMLYGLALIKPTLPLIDYYIKLDEYEKNCVNKAKPEMHCNGQCILMQKLKAFNEQEHEPVAPVPVKISLEDYPIGLCEESAAAKSSLSASKDFGNPLSPPVFISSYIVEIFHPPSKSVCKCLCV